jgi:hypothetical protein
LLAVTPQVAVQEARVERALSLTWKTAGSSRVYESLSNATSRSDTTSAIAPLDQATTAARKMTRARPAAGSHRSRRDDTRPETGI